MPPKILSYVLIFHIDRSLHPDGLRWDCVHDIQSVSQRKGRLSFLTCFLLFPYCLESSPNSRFQDLNLTDWCVEQWGRQEVDLFASFFPWRNLTWNVLFSAVVAEGHFCIWWMANICKQATPQLRSSSLSWRTQELEFREQRHMTFFKVAVKQAKGAHKQHLDLLILKKKVFQIPCSKK